MRIIIDVGPMGETHFIETDSALTGKVADPTNPSQQIDIVTLLTRMNSRPDLQLAGGWLVQNQLPGEPAPITRWQRMLNAVASPAGDATIKALGLK